MKYCNFALVATILGLWIGAAILWQFEVNEICGATANPSACHLALQAGDSKAEAIQSGNR